MRLGLREDLWKERNYKRERAHGEKKGEYIHRKNEHKEKGCFSAYMDIHGITVKSLVDFYLFRVEVFRTSWFFRR